MAAKVPHRKYGFPHNTPVEDSTLVFSRFESMHVCMFCVFFFTGENEENDSVVPLGTNKAVRRVCFRTSISVHDSD